MMAPGSPAVPVVHVAGGAVASPLGSPSLSSLSSPPPLSSRLRGREPSEDEEPLLLSSSRPGSLGPMGPSTTTRARRCLSRVARSRAVTTTRALFSSSAGGVNWLVRALFICLGMVLIGAVGSFTLRQVMSPQIESLLRQRNDMQVEIEALRNQVANQTRIAESRLEMIHLLEKELEKQVVAAAVSATAVPTDVKGAPLRGRPSSPFASYSFKANFWSTLAYAAVLGSLVMAIIAIRIYQIAHTESSSRTSRARAASGADTRHVALPMADDDDDKPSGGKAARDAECYKRAPGSAPQDRLVHV